MADITVSSAVDDFMQSANAAEAREIVGLSEYVSPKWYGAVGDGVANDTAAMQNALDAAVAAGKPLIIPGGRYLLSSNVFSLSDQPVEVIGHGDVTLIPVGTFTLRGDTIIDLTLASPVTRGDTVISVTDATGVTVGQGLRLTSDIIVEDLRNRAHDFCSLVTAISGNNITVARPATLNFAAADAGFSIRSQALRPVTVRNIKFEQSGANRAFDLFRGTGLIEDCEFYRGDLDRNQGIAALIDNCINLFGRGNSFRDILYGVQFQTCSQCRFVDTKANRTRHPLLPTFWSDGLYFDGLYGEDNTSIMDSHEAFDVNYANVNTSSDRGTSNIRSAGGSFRDSQIAGASTDGLPFNSISFVSAPYDYTSIYTDSIDFVIDNVVLRTGGNLFIERGRRIRISNSQFLKYDGVTLGGITASQGGGSNIESLEVSNCVYDPLESLIRCPVNASRESDPPQIGFVDKLVTTYDGAVVGEPTSVLTYRRGTGYADATGVALTGGTGTGATCDITTRDGRILSAQFNNYGSGYTVGDILTVSGGDANAQIRLNVVGGTGYADATGVALTGGTGTGATCDITTSGGVVVGLDMNAYGSGYTVGDVLTVSGGNADATFTLRVEHVVQQTYRLPAKISNKFGALSKCSGIVDNHFNNGTPGEVVFAFQFNPTINPFDNGGTSGHNFVELSFLTGLTHANVGAMDLRRTTFQGSLSTLYTRRFFPFPAFESPPTGGSNQTMSLSLIGSADKLDGTGKGGYYTLFFLLRSGRSSPRYSASFDLTTVSQP